MLTSSTFLQTKFIQYVTKPWILQYWYVKSRYCVVKQKPLVLLRRFLLWNGVLMRLLPGFFFSLVWNDHSPLLFRVFQASEGKGEASEERETRATGKGAKRKKVGPVLRARTILVHVFTLAKWGSFTCTPALRPVPRLDGQVKMYPRCWFHINSCPWRLMSRSTSLSPRQKRSNTERMSPPFSIEMTRVWSSSFIQTRKFLSLLWKIPRASGQSRAMPAHVRRGETGLSNRKWSSINCCCSAAVIPFSG